MFGKRKKEERPECALVLGGHTFWIWADHAEVVEWLNEERRVVWADERPAETKTFNLQTSAKTIQVKAGAVEAIIVP